MSSIASPLVSIITPVCNSERFFGATIESVLAQNFSAWEMLCVIDPSSTDQSESIAREVALKDPRVRVLKSAGFGVAAARNSGMHLAKGEYVAFVDSDDLWLPEKLEYQLRQTQASGATFSCTAFRRIDVAGLRLGRKIKVPESISYRRLLEQNCILASSVLLERKFVGNADFPDVGCEDFAFWLKLLKPGINCLGLPKDMVRYRIVPGSYGSSKWRSLASTWRIYRDQEKLGPLKSLSLLVRFVIRAMDKYSRF